MIISLPSVLARHATIPAAFCEYFGQVSVCGSPGINRIGNQSGLKFSFHLYKQGASKLWTLSCGTIQGESSSCPWKSLLCVENGEVWRWASHTRKDPRLARLTLQWNRKKGLQQAYRRGNGANSNPKTLTRFNPHDEFNSKPWWLRFSSQSRKQQRTCNGRDFLTDIIHDFCLWWSSKRVISTKCAHL